MDFFERQRVARGTTLRLVLLFALAVVSVVLVNNAAVLLIVVIFDSHWTESTLVGYVIAMTIFTLLVVGGGSASRMIGLRGGGAAVAQSVGAVAVDPSTSDPRLRRFVNVVEEMSIASGVPMPRLFVLEQEPGINAFAAGYSPADAAITVTFGALDRLNRDELQGVIGHEFSHVLNGDMRLNVRLIGLLAGIMLLGLIGLRFLVFGGFGGRSRGGGRGDSNQGVMVLIALALVVVGFVGQFFAGLIKAAVSRQREWLADASSVQFTRQTTGLVGALKKIAGLPAGSKLTNAEGEREVSHMLFGQGRRAFASPWATHPPLLKRIAALDPTFRPEEVDQLQQQYAEHPPSGLAEDVALGLAAAPAPRPAPETIQLDPAAVAARVRTLTVDDLASGAWLNSRIPPGWHTAANQGSTAVPLVLALTLDEDPAVRADQLRGVAARLGRPVADATAQLASDLPPLEPILRLPVAELAAPQLAARPPADRAALVATLDDLARADRVVSVFEYCLARVVGRHLLDAAAPRASARPGHAQIGRVQDAALTLLAVVAAAGNPDPAAAERAFKAATARMLPGTSVPFTPPADPWTALDAGWAVLNTLDPRHKQVLVESVAAAISHDGVVTESEAELLRCVSTVLRCPLPPLAA